MTEFDKFLGMNRPITRRDFLQGMALGVAGAALACQRPPRVNAAVRPAFYPPEASGLRGQDMASTQLGHLVRDDVYLNQNENSVDTGEAYDLIVIGAGLSGLSAVHVYQQAQKNARILLLDNHDDFGGHARRNTFHWNDSTLIAPGGTFALEDVDDSPPEALAIFKSIGIDLDRIPGFRDTDFKKRFNLSSGVFFDPRVYAGIAPTWRNKFYDIPYEEFFAGAPLSAEARRELIEFFTTRKHFLPETPDLEAALAEISWEKFIRERMGLGDHAVRFANMYATDLLGLGCDAVSALEAYHIGPGFFGMGGEGFYEAGGILRYGYAPQHRFPDGNHTVARHLLKAILPLAVPRPGTMEGIFNSRIDYAALDLPKNRVRVRLRSVAVRVENRDNQNGGGAVVHYVQPDGRLFRVRARSVIVSAWGMAAKHIVPELPAEQFRALDQYRYCSAVYINVLLRHWRPMAELGLFDMFLPDGYCTWMNISDPLQVGDYRPEYHPDKPTVLSMYKYLYQPGYDPTEQMQLARLALEHKPFEDFEREIRMELNLMFGSWGFDAADDILALTVNRWGHGYNFFKAPTPYAGRAHPPYERGRRKLGRISFAGADAAGNPWSQSAMQQGWRAAQEQLEYA
ncbi:hypothetical protein DWB58_23925 [candidate division KSB1 bacterium]|nr:hypothetical protein [candidate division KSB1 bacterium]